MHRPPEPARVRGAVQRQLTHHHHALALGLGLARPLAVLEEEHSGQRALARDREGAAVVVVAVEARMVHPARAWRCRSGRRLRHGRWRGRRDRCWDGALHLRVTLTDEVFGPPGQRLAAGQRCLLRARVVDLLPGSNTAELALGAVFLAGPAHQASHQNLAAARRAELLHVRQVALRRLHGKRCRGLRRPPAWGCGRRRDARALADQVGRVGPHLVALHRGLHAAVVRHLLPSPDALQAAASTVLCARQTSHAPHQDLAAVVRARGLDIPERRALGSLRILGARRRHATGFAVGRQDRGGRRQCRSRRGRRFGAALADEPVAWQSLLATHDDVEHRSAALVGRLPGAGAEEVAPPAVRGAGPAPHALRQHPAAVHGARLHDLLEAAAHGGRLRRLSRGARAAEAVALDAGVRVQDPRHGALWAQETPVIGGPELAPGASHS
mmetsp:Transcript_109147/g.304242  ORF Transcript_109147/g.304242 Transcript_109147/m.304242 type:complete len:441 (-) Transcript_109147:1228-2550(-)